MPHAFTSMRAAWRGKPKAFRVALAVVLVVGVAARLAVFAWSNPWSPHHPDEHILPVEAIALWEGITPREVGWPASTMRLMLSAVSATQWLAQEGATAWHERHDPQRALGTVADWIGHRYVDPSTLYMSGRMVSLLIGLLQLGATAWALSRWTGERGVLAGTMAVAVSPLAVLHSQYVLADVTGVLFATVMVGLAARPTDGQILGMGALAGLAAASKFHFGLWLLTPLLCIWLKPASALHRLRLSLIVTGLAGWVVVALVPWFWTSPLLAVKEFGGVVLAKVGGGAGAARIPVNLAAIFSGLGLLLWVGAPAGALFLLRRDADSPAPEAAGERGRWRQLLVVLVPTLLGTVALAGSTAVAGRYGLVLLPGVVVLAGGFWNRALAGAGRLPGAMLVAVALCLGVTTTDLVRAELVAGEVDVDVLARDWVLAHVPRGSRVATHDEWNAYLPQATSQLQQCTDDVSRPEAYAEKWRVLGDVTAAGSSRPFLSAVLNDELFRAYVCRRILAVSTEAGYVVVPYHAEPRFGARLESDVLEAFRTGASRPDQQLDVLVASHPVDVGMPPAVTLRTRRGMRVIYLAARH